MKRILIAAIITLLAASVFATSYNYPVRYGATSIDSVWVIKKYKNGGTKVDSAHFVATAGNLDKDSTFGAIAESSYVFVTRWYWQSLSGGTQKYMASYDDVPAILPTTTWTSAQRDTLLNRSLVIKDSAYAILDTLQNTSSALRVDTNTVLSVAQRDTLLNRSLVTKDSVYAILDTLQNTSSALRVDTNTVLTAANRDTLLNRTLVTKDSVYAILDTLQNTSSALRVDTNTVLSAAQRDTLLNRALVIKDSVYAILDTLQNVNSALRVDTGSAGGGGLDSAQTWAIANSAAKRAILKDTTRPILADGSGYVKTYGGTIDTVLKNVATSVGAIDSIRAVATVYNVANAVSVDTITKGVTVGGYTAGLSPGAQVLYDSTKKILASATGRVYNAATSAESLAFVTRMWNDLTTAQKLVTVAGYSSGYRPLSPVTAANYQISTDASGNFTGSIAKVDSARAVGTVGLVTKVDSARVVGTAKHVSAVDTGAIVSSSFTDAGKHMIAIHSDSGTVAVIDSAALAGVTLVATVPDSLWTKLGALYSKEFGSGLMHVKYISPTGDHSDGTTWPKAYSSPNYITAADSNTIFLVEKGTYDTVHTEILGRNIAIIGVNKEMPIFRNDSIAYGSPQKDAISVYKPNFYISGIDFWGYRFSDGDEDSLGDSIRNPWPNPITVYGTAHNFTADGCRFRECYKGIVTIDSVEAGKCDTARSPLNGTITNCDIRDGQMFGFDVNFNGFDCHGNTIVGIRSNGGNGAAGGQLFTGARNSQVYDNRVDSVGIAWALQNDTGTTIGPNVYGYIIPQRGRITTSGSVHLTINEPDWYKYADVKPDGTNWLTDPGMEQFHVDVRNPDPWVVYLSKGSTPPDTSFPDARVVQTTVRSGNWSWYAACTQATVQQATLVQTLRLDSASYVISCMAYGNAGGVVQIKAVPLSGTLGDSTYHVFTIDSANTWRPLVWRFNHTNSGMVKVEFIIHSYPSVTTAYLDDFSVTKEPTANVTGIVATAVIDSNQTYRMNALAIHDSLTQIRSAQVAQDDSAGLVAYLGSFAEYRTLIKRNCGINTSSSNWLPDSTLDAFVREGAIEVGNAVGPYKGITNITTTFNQMTYGVDSLITKVLSVVWLHSDSVKALEPKDRSEWKNQTKKFTAGYTGEQAKPDYYSYIDGYLSVYPIPYVTGDTLQITAWKRLPNIKTSSSINLIPQQYRPCILKYATWKAASSKQHPLAEEYKAQYEQSSKNLAENLIQEQTGQQGGNSAPTPANK